MWFCDAYVSPVRNSLNHLKCSHSVKGDGVIKVFLVLKQLYLNTCRFVTVSQISIEHSNQILFF